MQLEPTTVHLRDIDVAYRPAGRGATVVLIHGLGQDHQMWTAQQEMLNGYRTIAYDLRGHGRSTAGEGDGTLAQLGGDLIALLDHVGPARCVGFSLGGTVALWAASERPDLVPAVAAIATSSVVGRAAAAFFAARIELFSAGDPNAIRKAAVEDTRSQIAAGSLDVEALAAARLEAIGNARGYINAARAMVALREVPLNDRLELIRQPVIVISGEHDAFCPRRAAEIMLEHLVDARFEELPGVGHLVADEDPDAVTRVLQQWLDRGPGT